MFRVSAEADTWEKGAVEKYMFLRYFHILSLSRFIMGGGNESLFGHWLAKKCHFSLKQEANICSTDSRCHRCLTKGAAGLYFADIFPCACSTGRRRGQEQRCNGVARACVLYG